MSAKPNARALGDDSVSAGLSKRQDLFELLRQLDRRTPSLPRLGACPDVDATRLEIRQSADFAFASREVVALSGSCHGTHRLTIEVRNGGMFAPYGPLPIAMTDRARAQAAGGERIIEAFANLLVTRPTLSRYRAWSQLNPAVSSERPDDTFRARLAQLAGSASANVPTQAVQLRELFPGAYRSTARSLPVLGDMLMRLFGVPVTLTPRHPGWIESDGHTLHPQPRHLGRTRLGRRFYDIQNRVKVTVGPLRNDQYLPWNSGTDCVRTITNLVNDFTAHRVEAEVIRVVELSPEMGMRLGTTLVGHSSWLRPRSGMHAKSLT